MQRFLHVAYTRASTPVVSCCFAGRRVRLSRALLTVPRQSHRLVRRKVSVARDRRECPAASRDASESVSRCVRCRVASRRNMSNRIWASRVSCGRNIGNIVESPSKRSTLAFRRNDSSRRSSIIRSHPTECRAYREAREQREGTFILIETGGFG